MSWGLLFQVEPGLHSCGLPAFSEHNAVWELIVPARFIERTTAEMRRDIWRHGVTGKRNRLKICTNCGFNSHCRHYAGIAQSGRGVTLRT